MANQTKELLRGIAKYAEIVNAHLKDFHERLELIEATIRKRPELVAAYNTSLSEKRKVFSPGPNVQLQAIQQAIERIPN
jgi:hypothetical protein